MKEPHGNLPAEVEAILVLVMRVSCLYCSPWDVVGAAQVFRMLCNGRKKN